MNAAVVIFIILAASLVVSLALVAGVAGLLRLRPFDAATRHTLWFATLIAIALLPVIGIGASVVRMNRAPTTSSVARLTRTAVQPASKSLAPATSTTRAAGNSPHTAVAPAFSFNRLADALSNSVATGIDLVLAAGALLGLGILSFNIARIRAVKRRSSPLDGDLADELPWLTDPKLAGRETYLRLSYEIETPVAIGFKRPVILIPTELATHNGLQAIEDLVVHEHAHLRRFDDYTNLIQRAIERALWFNPLVWFVGNKVALEREIAADDVVVSRNAEVTRYADALWRLAREMRMPAHALVAPGALFTRKQISVRIEALLAPGRARLAHLGPVTAACALLLAGACGTLVALAAPALELPAPPAPPAVALPAHVSAPQAPLALKLPAAAHAWVPAAPKAPSAPAMASHRVVVPAQHIDVPAQHIEVPAEHIDVPAQHFEVSEHDAAPVAPVHPAFPRLPKSPAVPALPAHAVAPPGFDPAEIARLQNGASDVSRAAAHLAATKVAAAFGGAAPSENDSPVTVSRAAIANCVGCNLAHRDLRGLDLHGVDLSGTDFNGADLRDVNLAGARLSGTNLSHANLDGANLSDAEFVGVDISDASFRGARLDGLKLTGMSLRHATFDGGALRAILLTGCSGCDLSHMDLHGADLHGVSLIGTDLSHTDLSGANLRNARLSGVSLDGANLRDTDFRGAALMGCSLDGADTSSAHFEGASLTGTSLR